MALDNAQFIAELSITDPPGTDPLSQGDDQIRTIKRATQQSFPNIDKAVTLTADQLLLAAIKNEANVFTDPLQTIQGTLAMRQPSGILPGVVEFKTFTGDVLRWQLTMTQESAASPHQFSLVHFDAAGAFQGLPFIVDAVTGILNFDHVPTIQGAPIWIAGEIRQFAIVASPGANWFLADGTNGTVNLADRWLVGAGAFAGAVGSNLNAELDAQAAAGGSGSTAISEAQMPSHSHDIRNGGAGGVTDSTIGAVSTETVVGGSRGSPGGNYIRNNSSGNEVVRSSGSGAGHTHTTPAAAVTALNPTFTGSVQPVSVAVGTYQYVP